VFRGELTTPGGRAQAWTDSLLVDHGVFRLVWSNFATVVPGRLYRSNHPSPMQLRLAHRRYGLRTLINLRGPRNCGSDALSREAAERLGMAHVDAPFESRGAPHRDRLLRLARLLGTIEYPALIHCKSGADRAGLVAGVFLLLNGGTAEQALAQLSWRFGHFRRSRTGILDAFFEQYRRGGEGRLAFLDWVRDQYDEAALRAGFTAGGRVSSFVTDRLLQRE
jgi:protein tyrosine/serine phosphatase